ncbi:O-methyltransferase involved in polyketide biosynthesis [Nocardia tenerifensis]|uniref:O-methyltransferase involved in polyketide biosynthesis n=1 Tax=Nocardia tenerifensis TaxID=228006 RepID=A0A318KFY4_9NOCA|nr:class I SAM-dependent methyltransferase [Nocardia tenerifensis]PXX71073.1 O-methyltransferase involved in polyketide biosynthesis [Nocardia tenerifensis]
MLRIRPDLDPIQETLLLTLRARALDASAPTPILGDTHQSELADRLDYDFAKLELKPSLIYGTALRARKLDDAVRAFTAVHPNAVVLDLGCGLDTRMLRCEPPAEVDWYDIDYPEVIDLRGQLLSQSSHLVGADLTHPGWTRHLPTDRPTMIIAEGLLPFLPGDTFHTMIREVTIHCATGELALNGYTRFAAWAMKYHPSIKALGIRAAQGFDDPHEPETWGARLTLIEEQLLTRAREVALFPQPLRALTQLTARSASLSRQANRILRYGF